MVAGWGWGSFRGRGGLLARGRGVGAVAFDRVAVYAGGLVVGGGPKEGLVASVGLNVVYALGFDCALWG